MLPKATLNSEIVRASVEDSGETLICMAKIYLEDMERVGIDPSVVWTEQDESDRYCVVDINTTRQWWLDEYI